MTVLGWMTNIVDDESLLGWVEGSAGRPAVGGAEVYYRGEVFYSCVFGGDGDVLAPEGCEGGMRFEEVAGVGGEVEDVEGGVGCAE